MAGIVVADTFQSSTTSAPTFANTSGTQMGTLCRAWVNFNGAGSTSTNQTIRASFNVSNVFKNATGDYTIYFTNAMPDANYCVSGTAQRNVSNDGGNPLAIKNTTTPLTTTSVRVATFYPGGSNEDTNQITVAIDR